MIIYTPDLDFAKKSNKLVNHSARTFVHLRGLPCIIGTYV